MAVCEIELYWEEVPCDIYVAVVEEVTGVDGVEGGSEEDDSPGFTERGGAPLSIVLPVQIASEIWKLHIIGLVTLPWWLILASIAIVDYVLDFVWLGLFFWCRSCAGIFIWLINIAFLPFHIFGWLMRFRLETYGAIVDGWLLLLNGSGCYLQFGRHCWFNPTFNNRHLRTYWDIPLLWLDKFAAAKATLSPPKLEHYSDVRKVGAQKRQVIFDLMPNAFHVVRALFETVVEAAFEL